MIKELKSISNTGDLQFTLPNHWSTIKLKFIASYFLSSINRHTKDDELKVNICHYPHAYKNEFIDSTTVLDKGTCNSEEYEKYKLIEGQIIITKDSESADDIGVPAYVKATIPNTVCGYHLGVIQCSSDEISSKFLFRYIQSNIVSGYFEMSVNGITRYGLGKPTVENLIVPFPPFQEQTQIAKYLDYQTNIIDQLIEKKEKLVELLQEQRQAIINEAVTKGLDPKAKMKDSEIEWLGEIPEEWKLVRLKHLASYFLSSVGRNTSLDEKKVKICHYPYAYKNEFIDNHTILDGGTCTQDQFEKFKLKKGQIIITKDSESADDIGVPCFISEDIENGICGYHLGTIECYDNRILPIFLFRFFQSSIVSNFFELTVNGITRFGLGKPTVENLFIPLPLLDQQKKIISKIDKGTKNIDSLKVSIVSQVQKLKEYRQSIISEAVTGKIDLRKWKPPKK